MPFELRVPEMWARRFITVWMLRRGVDSTTFMIPLRARRASGDRCNPYPPAPNKPMPGQPSLPETVIRTELVLISS